MRARRPVGRPRGVSKVNAAKVFCVRGHAFDGENTRYQVDADGYVHRQSRACDRHRDRRPRRAG